MFKGNPFSEYSHKLSFFSSGGIIIVVCHNETSSFNQLNSVLTNEESKRIEGEINLSELDYALFKKMKGSSAPGMDRFTVNWLRKFWDSLKLVTYKLPSMIATETKPLPLHLE